MNPCMHRPECTVTCGKNRKDAFLKRLFLSKQTGCATKRIGMIFMRCGWFNLPHSPSRRAQSPATRANGRDRDRAPQPNQRPEPDLRGVDHGRQRALALKHEPERAGSLVLDNRRLKARELERENLPKDPAEAAVKGGLRDFVLT